MLALACSLAYRTVAPIPSTGRAIRATPDYARQIRTWLLRVPEAPYLCWYRSPGARSALATRRVLSPSIPLTSGV